MLFEGCPDEDMDLVWRGRVELMAVDGVLPDTSVKLRTKRFQSLYAKQNELGEIKEQREQGEMDLKVFSVSVFTCCPCH